MRKFKYCHEIEELEKVGISLPDLKEPNTKESYRFIFSEGTDRNHLPAYILQPNRLSQEIKKGKVTTNGYSLSNFETIEQAECRYEYLRKVCKNIKLSIGDTLSGGIIENDDGKITETNGEGHFELYEYENCDLNQKFHVIKGL